MDEYKIDVLEPAEEDLRDICRYISDELSAPLTAQDVLENIVGTLAKLSYAPKGHPRVPDEHLAAKGYRMVSIKNYIALYTVNEQDKVVEVERILYGRRDWMWILRKERP